MSVSAQFKKNIRQILFSTSSVAPAGIGEYLPLKLRQDMVLVQPLIPERAGLLTLHLSFDSAAGFAGKDTVSLELVICETGAQRAIFKTSLNGDRINRFTRTEISLAPAILWPGKSYDLTIKVVSLDEKTDLIINTVQKSDAELIVDARGTGLSLATVSTYATFNTLPLMSALLLLAASVYLLFFPAPAVEAIFTRFIVIPILLAPLITIFIVELLNTLNEKFWLPAGTFILNYIVILLFQVLLAGIFNHILPAIFTTLILFGLLSLANHFKQFFRGDPLFAADIAAAGMAMKTRGHLLYEVQLRFLLAFFCILVFFGLFSKIEADQLQPWLRSAFIAGSFLLNVLLAYLILFNNKWAARYLKIGSKPWNPMNDYSCGGFVIPFYRSVRDLIVVSPKRSSKIPADFYVVPANTDIPDKVQPDIIAIMSESFCDFRNIRDFNVSEPVIPFYDKLLKEDNVISGKLFVPVFGGGTSNTEFEYLTGSSMFFFNEASVPYLNYFRRSVHSLPSLLEQQGYSCRAIHPYMKSFYNRGAVYPLLGFDRFITMEEFPEGNLVDQFISDKADYDMILNQLPDSAEIQPGFIFSVTMQNHFPYHGTEENLANLRYHIKLTDIINSEGVEYFLSKLRESDDALSYLIERLKSRKRPTLLVFFGDHLPGNNSGFNNFYTELFGKSLAELDFAQTRKLYETPYFIWANYKLPSLDFPLTSGNFLGLKTCQLANCGLTPYYSFLSELNREVIALGNRYAVCRDGTYDLDSIPDELSSKLRRYWAYQYDNIISLKSKKH